MRPISMPHRVSTQKLKHWKEIFTIILILSEMDIWGYSGQTMICDEFYRLLFFPFLVSAVICLSKNYLQIPSQCPCLPPWSRIAGAANMNLNSNKCTKYLKRITINRKSGFAYYRKIYMIFTQCGKRDQSLLKLVMGS